MLLQVRVFLLYVADWRIFSGGIPFAESVQALFLCKPFVLSAAPERVQIIPGCHAVFLCQSRQLGIKHVARNRSICSVRVQGQKPFCKHLLRQFFTAFRLCLILRILFIFIIVFRRNESDGSVRIMPDFRSFRPDGAYCWSIKSTMSSASGFFLFFLIAFNHICVTLSHQLASLWENLSYSTVHYSDQTAFLLFLQRQLFPFYRSEPEFGRCIEAVNDNRDEGTTGV